jgi:GT2 family glycosyltransferase
MTLAPARPDIVAPVSSTGVAPPVVTAVVVSGTDATGVGEALTSVLAQSLLPDEVLVVDRTGVILAPDASPRPAATDATGAGETDTASPSTDPDGTLGSSAEEEPADAERDAAARSEVPAEHDQHRGDDAAQGPAEHDQHREDLADGQPVEDEADHEDHEDRADPPEVTFVDVVATVAETTTVPVRVVTADPRRPVRAAVLEAVRGHPAPDDGVSLLWFVPVGVTPEPGALVALVDAWRRSPSTGLLGPKHLEKDIPSRLQALSIRSTRGGRVIARPIPGEPDQGQYDRMSDALAVPFAGTVVERDLLLGLRGWDTSLGDMGADLDLGWRAQACGRRVVVVPSARMHSAEGAVPATASTPARRRAARRVALARTPWWSTPFLAAWIVVTSLLAALALMLLKRPRAAWAELSSLSSVDPIRGLRSRWRTRHRRTVRRRHLRSLFEPRRAVLTGWGDAVHHSLVPPQPPAGEQQAIELNPRSWLVKVLTHPAIVATLAAALVAAVAARSLGTGVWTGLGAGLSGGELVGTSADAQTLWHAWTDGWSGSGLGGPDPVGPSAMFLAGPAWLVAHIPLVPAPASPAGLVVAVLVLLAMPLAAVSAYLAARVVVTRPWVRALVAFAWATSGVAAAAVAQGRLGAAVALVLLPAGFAGLWLVAVCRSTATSAFATALAMVGLGAFAPVLLVPVVGVALVLAVVRRGVRTHALVIALLPPVLLAPWLVPALQGAWPTVAAGAGLAQWGGEVPPVWRLALLDPGGPGAPLVWTTAPLVAVGLLSLARGRRWRAAETSMAALLPVLLALALVGPTLRLGTVPAGVEGTGEPIVLWPGTFLLPLVLLVVVSLGRALDRVPLKHLSRTRLAGSWMVLTVGLAAVLVGAGGVAWGTLGDLLSPWKDPRPAVAVEQASGSFATRSLFVVPGESGAGYRLVGREASDVVRPLPQVSRADGQAADGVTALLDAQAGGDGLVAASAVDLLAIRGEPVPELARRLDATAGLQRISPHDGWEMWRVSPTGERDQALVASPRLRMETPEETRLVETLGENAATVTSIDAPADSRLVVAQPPGWAEHAVVAVDGRVLSAMDGEESPTYELPEGSARLTVDVVDPQHGWHVAQLGALVVLGFLAVPFGRRETRVVDR